MSRDKPWLKMWTEWLGDAKMDRLSLAEQGAWWRLVSLAHECGHLDEKDKPDGALIVAGTPLSLVEIMKSLKITEAPDQAVFSQMLDKMKNAGSLHWSSNTLVVTHYEERQRALTDTKEDRARRQRERRDALKEKAEKSPSPGPSPLLEEESKRREAEAEAESHAQTCHENAVTQPQTPKTSRRKSVTIAEPSNGKSVTIAELSRCYERYIGLLNPVDADRMREFTEYYESHEGKVDWIERAFKNAPVNKRRWPYIQAILERYIEEGGPDGRAGQKRAEGKTSGETGQQRVGTPQRDPLEGAREEGWEVIGGDEPKTAAGNKD